MKPKLIFSDADVGWVTALQTGFDARQDIRAVVLQRGELMRLPGLDAIFLTVMAAERLGAKPIPHQAQVLATGPDDRERGYPPFVVAGVALHRGEDARDVRLGLAAIVTAVVEAVARHNSRGASPIRTVGLGPEWVRMKELSPEDAAQIICAAYDKAED